jgi:hypothetical protein
VAEEDEDEEEDEPQRYSEVSEKISAWAMKSGKQVRK